MLVVIITYKSFYAVVWRSDSRYSDDPLINATKIYDTSHYL